MLYRDNLNSARGDTRALFRSAEPPRIDRTRRGYNETLPRIGDSVYSFLHSLTRSSVQLDDHRTQSLHLDVLTAQVNLLAAHRVKAHSIVFV